MTYTTHLTRTVRMMMMMLMMMIVAIACDINVYIWEESTSMMCMSIFYESKNDDAH